MDKTKEQIELEDKEIEQKAKKMAEAIKAELGIDELRKEMIDNFASIKEEKNESVMKIFVSEDVEKSIGELTKKERIDAYARAIFQRDHAVLKTLSEGGASGADGGYTVPQDFYQALLAEIVETVNMRNLVTVVPMKTNTLTLSMIDHGPNVYWTAEGIKKTTATADFSAPTITAYKMAAIIYLTDELMDDSAFDLSSVLISRFADVIATEEDRVILIGNGTTQPTGIINAGTVATLTSVALNFNEIIALIYMLPVKFRKNARFIIHPNNVRDLRLLKDSYGRYLWSDPVAPGQPATIQGYPVVENYWLPQTEILFGDFKYGYWLGDRQKMTVKISNDTETTFTEDKTAIRIVERIGGTVVFPNAIRQLTAISH